MELGIFAKLFEYPTEEAIFKAVITHDLFCVQFDMACAGLPSMPDEIPPEILIRIRNAASASGVRIMSVSGYYNMIHPDERERDSGMRRLRVLAGACQDLGTSMIALCTGTRDPQNMWKWHDRNNAADAWRDLVHEVERALRLAEEYQVILIFEPEHSNVLNSSKRTRELLDIFRSPWLKVVVDGANLIEPGQPQQPFLDEAFDLLADDIVMAHAKDRSANGGFCTAGQGVLDYPHYLRLLQTYTAKVPLLFHSLAETEVASNLGKIRGMLAEN
jgi:sugar phosphate isomerase/epimerase